MIGNSNIQGVSDPHARGDGVVSMSVQITNRLRNAIVFAELPPGTRLKQDDLALRFGASRVPLREAMRQLTAEGLIDWPSNKSAVVRTLAFEEIEELFELGRLLEARATRLGTPHLGDDDVAELHRLEAGMRDPALSLPGWYQANLEFHMIPMSRSGQKRTMEIVSATRRNLTRYFLTPALYERDDGDWRDKHAEEHRGLLDALGSRDQDTAGMLIERHWLSTWEDWKRHLATGNRGKLS
jgi:DNA-binding GntR family transcriptional regulator